MQRLDEYAEKAHNRAKRRKSPWNLLLIPLCIAGIAGSWTAMVVGLLNLQHGFIPDGAILSSHTRLGGIFLFVPALFPALGLGMMLANLAAWCVVPARRIFQKEARGIEGASFKEAMKYLGIGTLVFLVIAAPLSALGVMNYFYVTEDGVHLNPTFAVKETHYAWADITEIQTRCIAERDNLHLNYRLRMKDGRTVDLLEETRLKFLDAYDEIRPLIESQPHIRYSKDIRPSGVRRLQRRYKPHHAEQLLRILQLHDPQASLARENLP